MLLEAQTVSTDRNESILSQIHLAQFFGEIHCQRIILATREFRSHLRKPSTGSDLFIATVAKVTKVNQN